MVSNRNQLLFTNDNAYLYNKECKKLNPFDGKIKKRRKNSRS